MFIGVSSCGSRLLHYFSKPGPGDRVSGNRIAASTAAGLTCMYRSVVRRSSSPAARGWTAVEYVDHGVSGTKDRRPALDQLVADVRRQRVEAVACWRLDRLGRNLRHLLILLDDWQSRVARPIASESGKTRLLSYAAIASTAGRST